MDDVAIARALHVLAVVVWIGGVAMVTMVVLPAVRDGDVGPNRLVVFEAIERRFAWPARAATVIVGLTGFYMTQRLELWERFWSSEFWWMHAMVCLWLVFTVLLFVAEPLILHRWFHARANATPDTAFTFLHRAHWLLLVLSLITIFGAVAGSQSSCMARWCSGAFALVSVIMILSCRVLATINGQQRHARRHLCPTGSSRPITR